MLAHHAMPSFQCRSTCTHRECQRHAPVGFVNALSNCTCIGHANASSIFLENVLDLANTLAQIMTICGIHECKAKSTVDITTYAFLHYDQVCYCLDSPPKKRLRKDDLFHELGRKCLMNRVEAHLAYTIIKRGFKAFYFKPKETFPGIDASLNEECVYVHAAKKTAEAFARYDGLSCEEQRGFEAKIRVAFKKFFDRMQDRMNKPAGDECNCCFCAKKRGNVIYAKKPCESDRKKKHICPYCCKLKRDKYLHAGSKLAKCPKCHRSRKFCVCDRHKFGLDWVTSIWDRPDMKDYVKEKIDGEQQPLPADVCAEWFDPTFLKQLSGRAQPTDAACVDWFDPVWLKTMEFNKED